MPAVGWRAASTNSSCSGWRLPLLPGAWMLRAWHMHDALQYQNLIQWCRSHSRWVYHRCYTGLVFRRSLRIFFQLASLAAACFAAGSFNTSFSGFPRFASFEFTTTTNEKKPENILNTIFSWDTYARECEMGQRTRLSIDTEYCRVVASSFDDVPSHTNIRIERCPHHTVQCHIYSKFSFHFIFAQIAFIPHDLQLLNQRKCSHVSPAFRHCHDTNEFEMSSFRSVHRKAKTMCDDAMIKCIIFWVVV